MMTTPASGDSMSKTKSSANFSAGSTVTCSKKRQSVNAIGLEASPAPATPPTKERRVKRSRAGSLGGVRKNKAYRKLSEIDRGATGDDEVTTVAKAPGPEEGADGDCDQDSRDVQGSSGSTSGAEDDNKSVLSGTGSGGGASGAEDDVKSVLSDAGSGRGASGAEDDVKSVLSDAGSGGGASGAEDDVKSVFSDAGSGGGESGEEGAPIAQGGTKRRGRSKVSGRGKSETNSESVEEESGNKKSATTRQPRVCKLPANLQPLVKEVSQCPFRYKKSKIVVAYEGKHGKCRILAALRQNYDKMGGGKIKRRYFAECDITVAAYSRNTSAARADIKNSKLLAVKNCCPLIYEPVSADCWPTIVDVLSGLMVDTRTDEEMLQMAADLVIKTGSYKKAMSAAAASKDTELVIFFQGKDMIDFMSALAEGHTLCGDDHLPDVPSLTGQELRSEKEKMKAAIALVVELGDYKKAMYAAVVGKDMELAKVFMGTARRKFFTDLAQGAAE